MNFGLRKPCKTCPFVVSHDFPLRPDRIMEIRNADHFTCHNTIDYDGPDSDDDFDGPCPTRDTAGEQTCLGWLVLQWAQFHGFPSWVGFAASRGMFNPHALPSAEEAGVYATFEDYARRAEEEGW